MGSDRPTQPTHPDREARLDTETVRLHPPAPRDRDTVRTRPPDTPAPPRRDTAPPARPGLRDAIHAMEAAGFEPGPERSTRRPRGPDLRDITRAMDISGVDWEHPAPDGPASDDGRAPGGPDRDRSPAPDAPPAPAVSESGSGAASDWGRSDRDGRPFPLNPDDPADQQRLGPAWDQEPQRPQAIQLPDPRTQSDMLLGRAGPVEQVSLLYGDPRSAFPDDTLGDEAIFMTWNAVLDPTAIGQCGRDQPLEPGCDDGGGCWIATGDRNNPITGAGPVPIAAHLSSDGVITHAWTLREDEIDGLT